MYLAKTKKGTKNTITTEKGWYHKLLNIACETNFSLKGITEFLKKLWCCVRGEWYTKIWFINSVDKPNFCLRLGWLFTNIMQPCAPSGVKIVPRFLFLIKFQYRSLFRKSRSANLINSYYELTWNAEAYISVAKECYKVSLRSRLVWSHRTPLNESPS